MADEKKTYLVNIESNLDDYAKEAEKAAKEVDKLTVENLKMQQSDKASNVEKQKSAAALKVAQKAYRDAQKNVQTFTAALSSETGSRKQLGEVLRLQQLALGKLGNAYVKDEQGIRKLNPLYLEQMQKIKATKDAIVEYDKAQGDGRSSVGLYSEAIQGSVDKFSAVPGPIGKAGQAIAQYSKLLLANPIILVITGITAAIAGLIKLFKTTDSGATELAARMEQLKVILDVLRQRVIALIDGIKALIALDFEKLGDRMTAAFGGAGKQLKEATLAAYNYVQMLDIISNAEQNYVSVSAENRRQIAKLELMAQDLTIPVERRKAALKEAVRLGEEELAAQRKFAEDRYAAAVVTQAKINGLTTKELSEFTRMTDAEQANASDALKKWRDNNEDKAVELENLYATFLDLDTSYFTEQKRNIAKLSSFELQIQKASEAERQKVIDAAKKKVDDAAKAAEKAHKDLVAQLLAEAKVIDEMDKEDAATIAKKKKDAEDLAEWERNRVLEDFENRLKIRELNNESIFAIERDRLEHERILELGYAEKNGADVNLINKKYAAYNKKINEAEYEAKIGLWSGFAGNLATILGENTALGKAAAVAQTTIATYEAAMQAYKSMVGIPVVGPVLAVTAAAAATATGLRSIKKILSVDSGLPGDTGGGGQIPTSIVTAQAPRSFATSAGASFFTQPELSQTQLNAFPNENAITPEALAAAVSKLKPPVVTVEDINAKILSQRKVEVRAII